MSMQQRIQKALEPLVADVQQVLDESHMHSRGLETHFKAVLVSSQFDGLNAVKRHQKVYALMGELMSQIHALAVHTYTPAEWAEQGVVPASPTCLGGSKHDQAQS
jgi:BolA protein